MQFIKTYPCGLRLINDYMPDRKVESVAFFVASGSGYDLKNKEGIAHFYEHMFFKSTQKRNALEVNVDLDNLGAGANAFTGHDRTCYYSKVTTDKTEDLFEILSDCFFNGQFLEEEIKTEKGVVCSEIDKYQDDFLDCAINAFNENMFYGTNFAHPILGSKKSVLSITADDLREYRRCNNCPEHLIISTAGGVSSEEIEKLVEKYILPHLTGNNKPVVYSNTAACNYIPKKKYIYTKKDTQQLYFLMGCSSERKDDSKFILSQLASILFSGTMSSRLFTRLRENEGVVYSVSSSVDNLSVGGIFSLWFISNKSTAKQAILAVKDEINKVIEKGFSEEEIKKGKTILEANLKISDDNISSCVIRNASSLLDLGKPFDIEEKISAIQKITCDEVNSYFKNLLSKEEYLISVVSKDDDIDVAGLLR